MGISSREKGRLTMRLLVMSPKKKKLHVEKENSYYSEKSDEDGEELKEAYKTLYVEFEKPREVRKQHFHELNNLQTEKSSLPLKIQGLEEKLLGT